ncbi:MAG: gliding motility-associated C-terminal domain-containing protein, partial [Flavipsychrobacter sp.]
HGFGEGSASVCNNKGQLQFYTDGSIVWDRLGNIMPNGDTLITDPRIMAIVDTMNITPTASTSQGSLIVPMPDSPGKYYIFSQTSFELGTLAYRLYYSIVDMSLNGGLGDIVAGRRAILLDSNNTEKLTAVVGDHCDIWVLTCNATGSLKAFEITDAGINKTPVTSAIGFVSPVGIIKVSPDRKKLVACNYASSSAILYDFDPATGKAIKNTDLFVLNTYGASFSSNSSKVYLSTSDSIYQYDLSSGIAASITASKITVGAAYGQSKLAPDGKIYFRAEAGESLCVIPYPDRLAPACGYIHNAITLDSDCYMSLGLPNVVPVFIRDTVYSRRNVTLCFSDSSILHADTLGWDYTWEDGAKSNKHTVYNSGKYWVFYITAPCVHHTDTFNVNFATRIPKVGAFNGCKGANNSYLWIDPFPGDVNTYTYDWYDVGGKLLHTKTIAITGDTVYGLPAGSYAVNIKSNGCDTTITVILSPPNYYTSFAVDTLACIYDTVLFNNTSKGFTDYIWNFGDGATSLLPLPSHTYTHQGQYKVLLIGLPCNDTFSRTIKVDSFGYVQFTMDKSEVCIGQPAMLRPAYDGEYPNELTWHFGDSTTLSKIDIIQHAYDKSGKMVINLVAHYPACPATNYKDSINVYPYPVVYLGEDTSLCPGDPGLSITNHSGDYSDGYLWSTGATTQSIAVSQPATYWLTITSDHGCATTDTILVTPNCYIAIPNAFTPDGDGVNDYFFPRELLSAGIVAFKMKIFDRWGEQIFETNNINGRGWDGRFNSVSQPTGVYVYMIDVVFKNGYKQNYQGNVTLLSSDK